MKPSHPDKDRPLPVVSPQLRRLLIFVLALFTLLVINSAYLSIITVLEAVTGRVLQDPIYLMWFLVHLGLGLLLILPLLIFGIAHLRRAHRRPNRYAVGVGKALFTTALLLLISGLLLTRFGFLEINHPVLREGLYWIHVVAPFGVIWLFILHRLAGPRIRWQAGIAGGLVAVAFTGGMLLLQSPFNPPAEATARRPFLPSLVKLAGAERIPAAHLMTDESCAECHADIAEQSALSMHRLSSFNNPAYRFSIEDTREILLKRDQNMTASRLCAGCHDLVPLFNGDFDRTDYDPERDPGSKAGITCLGCHAITAINSPLGNGDYTISDPPRYPFAFSENPWLRALNRQLIKAKPAFHKKTLLKPLHKTAEFCAACHKVHLPFELNHYRWLRGQNHYDSFLLSGVSGHRVDSFYYPPRAVTNCAHCHMPLTASNDPAAREFTKDGERGIHNHLFAGANTAVAYMLQHPSWANDSRRRQLARAARVDIFGIKEGASIEGALHAPLRPLLPQLEPGKSYLIELVVRTLGVGHQLTQGTADSNELWLDVTLRSGKNIIGRSGGSNGAGEVDPWSYFINAYLLDRRGNRIDRRNAQDIMVALYDHQIPPGAATVVHYRLEVPPDATGSISIKAELQYRKFDSGFLRHVRGDSFRNNDLPITTLASDWLEFPLRTDTSVAPPPTVATSAWERWNDYGIGLLREGHRGQAKGELRQAAAAFAQVEALGKADGPLNLARVYYREGRLEATGAALQRASQIHPPAPPWTLAWFSALVDRDYGRLDAAIANLENIAKTRFEEARERGFDFSKDVNLLNELGRTYYERARSERGASRTAQRRQFLEQARDWLNKVLSIDPENAKSHYNLTLVYTELGDPTSAQEHRLLHEQYRPDDHAIERAVTVHRSRNPAADHAAEAVAIYDLQRLGAYELPQPPRLSQDSVVP